MEEKGITRVRSAPPRFHPECDEGCIVLILENEVAHLYDIPTGMIRELGAVEKNKGNTTYDDFQRLAQKHMDTEPEELLVGKENTNIPSELLHSE